MKNKWKKKNESCGNKKKKMNSGEYLQKKKENKNYEKNEEVDTRADHRGIKVGVPEARE